MTITFRGGRLPADPSKPRLRLSRYLTTATLPPVPATIDWDSAVSRFDVLGNDDWGDCHWAATYHALQTWSANTGAELTPTTTDTLEAYAEATGFDPHAGNPGSNATDQGTVMQDGLSYWRKTGIPVTTGAHSARHKILAFAEVNHRNPAELRQAVALFGEVLLGIAFPASAMDQFNDGQPWDVVPGSPIEGGHAICAAKYDATADTPWTIVTWGREQAVTQAFLDAYLEEAWVPVGPEWIALNGSTPSGLNLATLGQDFTGLTGEPAPWAGNTPPPVPPPRSDALVVAARTLASDQGVVAWSLGSHHGQARHVAALVRAVIRAAA